MDRCLFNRPQDPAFAHRARAVGLVRSAGFARGALPLGDGG